MSVKSDPDDGRIATALRFYVERAKWASSDAERSEYERPAAVYAEFAGERPTVTERVIERERPRVRDSDGATLVRRSWAMRTLGAKYAHVHSGAHGPRGCPTPEAWIAETVDWVRQVASAAPAMPAVYVETASAAAALENALAAEDLLGVVCIWVSSRKRRSAPQP